MGRRSVLVIVCLTLLSGAACFGQQIVINRIALLQTRLIQTTKSVGTAFVVNVDNREYWITAKHIFSGIENAPPGVFTTKTVQANILLPFSKGDNDQDKKWETVTFTTIDPGKDIDILVRRQDLPRIAEAVEPFGLEYRHAAGVDMLAQKGAPSARRAVRINFSSANLQSGRTIDGIPVPPLADLVTMKLTRFRIEDGMCLHDIDEQG